ncbi:MAG: ribosome-associated translation inhibitor RaiA [Bacillota bacterium]
MQVTVRGKNIDVTNALRDYVEKKLSKFDKYFENNILAQVSLKVERGRHGVEVTVPINGGILRAEEQTEDMYAAIDLVLEKLERQIHKYKTRINRKARQTGGKGIITGYVPDTAEDVPKIVRTKRFVMKPMSPEEAVTQMNMVGHDFYVFTNADTQRMSVVYRRKDGNYGLIDPEY